MYEHLILLGVLTCLLNEVIQDITSNNMISNKVIATIRACAVCLMGLFIVSVVLVPQLGLSNYTLSYVYLIVVMIGYLTVLGWLIVFFLWVHKD